MEETLKKIFSSAILHGFGQEMREKTNEIIDDDFISIQSYAAEILEHEINICDESEINKMIAQSLMLDFTFSVSKNWKDLKNATDQSLEEISDITAIQTLQSWGLNYHG